ncbi:MAG: hypothetical protein E7369_03995 [Clostridiales bacterium]|nr:hypothetical protein [Clostridiales bacterium]
MWLIDYLKANLDYFYTVIFMIEIVVIVCLLSILIFIKLENKMENKSKKIEIDENGTEPINSDRQ